jgi:hypothetical protein
MRRQPSRRDLVPKRRPRDGAAVVTASPATAPRFEYPPTMRQHRIHLIVFIALLVAAGAASAQIDPRARELLEGLQMSPEVRTLDQTMVATMYAGGVEQVVRTRTRIDYEGRRAAIDSEVAPGMAVRILIADGEARMLMGGVDMPMPPGMDVGQDMMFERGHDLLAEGVSASYDGFQAYGELLSGEQVTLRNAAGLAGLEGAQEQRLLFDDLGRLIGVVAEVPEAGGTMVGVLDEPQTGSPLAGFNAMMYLVRPDGTTEPFMHMYFEDVRVNEPIELEAFD